MMANLGVENNTKIRLSVTELPTGYFVKLKPQSVNFLNKISNPKAVLEHKLRNYAALKVGEVIYFRYVNNDYFLEVMECKPSGQGAISIIEANLEVDFAPPDGYVEPTAKKASSSSNTDHGFGSQFAMDEDTPSADGEVDDLGLGEDSDEESDKHRSSSRGAASNKAFSGAGHRPSGRAVALETPSLPDLASSPSGRKFITSSGSLVIGPPSDSCSSPAPTSTTSAAPSNPAAGNPKRSITPAGHLNSPAPTSSSPKPSVGNPVAATETKPSDGKFVAFSGAGYKLQ